MAEIDAMTAGELVVGFQAEGADNSKKWRWQNCRSKQVSLENGAAKAMEVLGKETSNSSPFQVSTSSPSSLETPSRKVSGKKYFVPYIPDEAVEEALDRGNAFKATFRVNVHNRLEAYCTIKGVPVDVLIDGVEAQNRAIDGDVVAVVVDPVFLWTRLRGSDSSGCLNIMPASDSCSSNGRSDGSKVLLRKISDANSTTEREETDRPLTRICVMINSHPFKRPTGRVLAILKNSPKRLSVSGFLSVKQSDVDVEVIGKPVNRNLSTKNKNHLLLQEVERIQLIPTDPKFPKMVVSISTLPDNIKQRVKAGDLTVERELVAAEIYEWNEETLYPHARVTHAFGRGNEIEPRMAAILFDNSISAEKFSPKSLACLPDKPWKIPKGEFKTRNDLRDICSFTIDPSSAIDLDDALSIQILSDEVFRVGVHIADVSYFLLPDTALDEEAQARSRSVYMLQNSLPMLPPDLTEELCSLLPGKDRLALSIIWELNRSGKIIDRWIGQSVIKSCCKLSYDVVQTVIDKSFNVDELSISTNINTHGNFSLKDVIESLRILYDISNSLRMIRFNDGALQLEAIKLDFLYDDYGMPCDSIITERKESCSLVEEFMLLANRSVAEVISQAFPGCALLRRHPNPNLRKLKEFEAFCRKHGFELDTSSSGQLHCSLLKIKEEIKDDPILFDIVTSNASKPMQPAAYFCTGDLKGKRNEWAHYALSVPLYTHFTSPIRRYPDIIVHRILCAVLHAENMYMKTSSKELEALEIDAANMCFTGLRFNERAAESEFGKQALFASALKFKIPNSNALGEVAAHCNERNTASRHAQDAGQKLYLWALLKKKEAFVTQARVLSLGQRFMSVYIQNFAMERRIYYDEVECLSVEWLELTGTVVLDLIWDNKINQRRGNFGKLRHLEDVVSLTDPPRLDFDEDWSKVEPAFFPLVLRNLSTVPVSLFASGGDDGPLDIGAKLYMCSYLGSVLSQSKILEN